jgi:Transposase, Mutator family
MTATLDAVTTRKRKDKPEPPAEQKLAEELVARAREQGVSLTGPEGLLKQLTKTVLETVLNQELAEHLSHGKHSPPGNEAGNVRNGTRAKTVLTEATGQVPIEVPRDRAGTFEPQIVRQRRLTGVDEMVLSLYAKGPTTGEISAPFAEIYGASVSKETISRITDKVLEEMADWCARPGAVRHLAADGETLRAGRVGELRVLRGACALVLGAEAVCDHHPGREDAHVGNIGPLLDLPGRGRHSGEGCPGRGAQVAARVCAPPVCLSCDRACPPSLLHRFFTGRERCSRRISLRRGGVHEKEGASRAGGCRYSRGGRGAGSVVRCPSIGPVRL